MCVILLTFYIETYWKLLIVPSGNGEKKLFVFLFVFIVTVHFIFVLFFMRFFTYSQLKTNYKMCASHAHAVFNI